jgi:hypothetical protein
MMRYLSFVPLVVVLLVLTDRASVLTSFPFILTAALGALMLLLTLRRIRSRDSVDRDTLAPQNDTARAVLLTVPLLLSSTAILWRFVPNWADWLFEALLVGCCMSFVLASFRLARRVD